MQAVIYACTNKIESAKIINLLLLISISCLVHEIVDKFLKNKFWAVIFTIVIILCPVTITQIFTFYIDFFYYLVLLGLITVSILLIKENKRIYLLIFIFLSTLICCIKFSTIPTFILLLVAIFIYLYLRKKQVLKQLLISVVLIFFLSIITNYNPFITNLMKGKHILFPLMGTEKVDIMSYNTPEKFKEDNRFVKFYYSTLSECRHMEYKAKIPFTIHKEEINPLHFYTPDLRLSGFGLLFSGILLLSIICFFCFLFSKNKTEKDSFIIFYIIFWIIISIIINPEFWWARYIPQLWLIPILLLLLIWKKKGVFNVLKYVTIAAFIINISVFIFYTLSVNIYQSYQIHSLLQKFKQSDRLIILDDPVYNTSTRFQEHNIRFIKGNLKENFEIMPGTFGNVKIRISDMK